MYKVSFDEPHERGRVIKVTRGKTSYGTFTDTIYEDNGIYIKEHYTLGEKVGRPQRWFSVALAPSSVPWIGMFSSYGSAKSFYGKNPKVRATIPVVSYIYRGYEIVLDRKSGLYHTQYGKFDSMNRAMRDIDTHFQEGGKPLPPKFRNPIKHCPYCSQTMLRMPYMRKLYWMCPHCMVANPRNLFPMKGTGARKFSGISHYYAGRTLYPSKAALVAQELRAKGIGVKITRSKSAGSLLWTTKPIWVDLSEPLYPANPILKGKFLTWEDLGNLKKGMTVIAKDDFYLVRGFVPKGTKGKIDYISHGYFKGVGVTFENNIKGGPFSPHYLIKANPILETIGSAAITGVGIGTGFKVANAAWDRMFRKKNPRRKK